MLPRMLSLRCHLGQVQSGDAGKTDQNIDMASWCREDAAKNVAIEKSPRQAQEHAGNQSSSSELGSPGHIQSHQAESIDQIIDMAVTPSGDVAKTDVAKKRKMQSTSADCINSSINKKIQSTSASDTNIIISSKKTKKMQSTPESDTMPLLTCKKLNIVEAIETPLAPIACSARTMATRVLTEKDGQYDFATQTTVGQGANVGGKSSSQNVEVERVESPIFAEMFLNCSKEGYKDHPQDLNSSQVQLKHVLESNGSRNQSSVEGSSHLPPNIIDVEQYEVVNLPKTPVLARPMKLRIRPLRQKGEPLAHDDIKQETTKGGSKQTSNVYHRKKRAKVSITKALVKDVEHSGTIGRLRAPVTSTEAQSKGVSSDNQPIDRSVKAITWKDSPIRGSEPQNSGGADVSSFSFEGTTAYTLLDQAIGDEVSEPIQQSVLISSSADQMLLEDESFPFIKCSSVWNAVESLEVFLAMPQKLHFRPLEQFDMVFREGLAIGSMVTFACIVEKVGKTKLDDPPSIFQEWSKALEALKAHGFNIQPIQARLETLIRIKNEKAKLNDKLMEVEDQISTKHEEAIGKEKEHNELNKKMKELQECLNQLSKKRELTVLEKEVQDSSMAELKKTLDNGRGCLHSVTSEFRTVVATLVNSI